MNNKILQLIAISTANLFFCQVGINTVLPKATLDVKAKTNGSVSNIPEGLIAPQLTISDLNLKSGAYGSGQIGALVYVTNISNSTPSGQTVNVSSIGYYYFDGNVWQKLSGGGGASGNIYSTDGTLQSNRTIELNDKSLTLSAAVPAVNQFNIDGTTFSVDTKNDRLGLGTNSPGSTLDVRGSFSTPLNNQTTDVLGNSSHSVVNFTNSGVFTLPPAISGAGNFSGREYQIRNGSSGNTVTVKTSGAETIDNVGAAINSFTVPGGYTVTIKSTGATSGNTWLISQMVNSNTSQSNTGQSIYSGNAGDTSKTVTVGNFIFRFSNASPPNVSPQIAMINNPGTTVNINVGVNQQFSTNGYEYANNSFTFDSSNYSTFRDIPAGAAAAMSPNELNIMNLVDSTNGRYYRITFYVSGNSAPYIFTIVAEKF